MGTATAQAVPSEDVHKNVHALSVKSRQFFCKLLNGGKSVFCHVDSGAEISIFPKKLLTPLQVAAIKPSSINIVAYGHGRVTNLGELHGDFTFEGENGESVDLLGVRFLITNSSMTPILGTDVLLPKGQDLHLIDKKREIAVVGGRKLKIYDGIVPKAKVVSGLRIATGDEQAVFCDTDFTIGPECEAVLPVYVKNKPSSDLVLVEPQLALGRILVAGGLSLGLRYSHFPVRVVNPGPTKITIRKGTKMAKSTTVGIDQLVDRAKGPTGGWDRSVFAVESSERSGARVDQVLAEMKLGPMSKGAMVELRSILHDYPQVFLLKGETPQEARLPPFSVNLKSEVPIAAQSYRTPYALRGEMRSMLARNLDNGLMVRGSSAYNSPTLLVKKSNGQYRLVCDYRRVNDNILADNYPLPRINDLLVNLKESRFFVQCDLAQGFHQIPITGHASDVLTVGNEHGQFKWQRMPMGVKSAPAYFQRQMDHCFRDVPLQVQLLFLDDLLTHGKEEMPTLLQFRNTVKILSGIGLQVAAAKTAVLVREVKFCGHRVRDGQVMVCKDRIKAVDELVPPRTKKGAQSIFGFFNYLRGFIRDFAKIARPITATFRGYHFRWTTEAQLAMDTLKGLVISNTLKLAIPDVNTDRFVLETDASDTTMAACLYICAREHQGDHGPTCLTPVEFYSENFTDAQVKKYILEKELMALRNALAKFRMYLLGRTFVWYTDSNSLRWAKSLRTSKDKIARLLAEVGEFDFGVQVRRSAEMAVTDCLSRPAFVNAMTVKKTEIPGMQKKDPILHKIRNFVKIDRWPNHPGDKRIAFYKNRRGSLRIDAEGYLIFNSGTGDKLVVPDFMKSEILAAYHDQSGHPGSDNTIATVTANYIWQGLYEDVREYVRSCQKCQREKPNLHPRKPPMAHTDTPSGPFVKLSCDLTGPLPMTDRDNVYILVICDHFSKRVSARALQSKHAAVVLQHFKDVVCMNPQMPRVVLTDNGTEFMGEFAIFLSSAKIRHVRSAPYHPQSNGQTERANQSLKARLQPRKNPHDWDLMLPEIVQQLNLAPNEQTRVSPFVVENGMVGNNPKNPIDFNRAPPVDLVELRKRVFERQVAGKSKMVEKHARPRFVPFSIGDRVWAKARGGLDRYEGPYVITELRGRGESYVIEDESGKSKVRRVEELKPYVSRSEQVTHVGSVTPPDRSDFSNGFLRLAPQWSFNSPFFGLGNIGAPGATLPASPSVPTSPNVPTSPSSPTSPRDWIEIGQNGENGENSENGENGQNDQLDLNEQLNSGYREDLLNYSDYSNVERESDDDVSEHNSNGSINTVVNATEDVQNTSSSSAKSCSTASLDEDFLSLSTATEGSQDPRSPLETAETHVANESSKLSLREEYTRLSDAVSNKVNTPVSQPQGIKLRSNRVLAIPQQLQMDAFSGDESSVNETWDESMASVEQFEAPSNTLSKDALRHHIKNTPYTRSEALFYFVGYRALRNVKRTYGLLADKELLAIDRCREYGTKKGLARYIIQYNPNIPCKIVDGFTWPVVTVVENYSQETSYPTKTQMKDGTEAVALQDQTYHQLLAVACWHDLPVEKAHLGNRRMILDRMCSSIINKGGDICYQVEDGKFWVMGEIGLI